MHMKKIFSTFVCFLCAIAMWGAKANSQPFTLTQPDGTQLTVVLHGDEHAHWYTTLDGTLLVQQNRAYYVAATTAEGTLSSTGLLAHMPALRTNAELTAVAKQDKAAFLAANEKQLAGGPRTISISKGKRYFPHTGSPKAVVLLVEFQDTTFTLPDPKASFQQFFNGEGKPTNLGNREDANAGSVSEYFKTMSFGNFTPQFDVYGPYKLDNNLAYYGANDDMARLIPDACKKANVDVDFSNYDSDGDGYVDLVYVIYAGYSESENGNATDCIWARAGEVNGGTYDGKQVYRYAVSSELISNPDLQPVRIAGLGVCVHEFSHTLGYPDMYPTEKSDAYNKDNQGMELWDLMDGGEYCNNGYNPSPYTAWEREVAGWFTCDTLTDTCSVADLAPIDKGGKAYKIFNGTTKEHVILQNIQQIGWNCSDNYTAKRGGHGLVAYRVNYGRTEVSSTDYPNNTLGKAQMLLLPADGDLLVAASCADVNAYYAQYARHPYPGSANVTSVEGFQMTDGSLLQKPLLNITETNGLISFDFLGKKYNPSTSISGVTTASEAPAKAIYTLDGRYAGTSESALAKGIYVRAGKKFVKQ